MAAMVMLGWAAREKKRPRMRSMAQKRFTAVGRVAARVLEMLSRSLVSAGSVVAELFLIPKATPMAAATPIAGAPRTTMVVMTLATWSLVVARTYVSSSGKRVWSRKRTPSAVHSRVGIMLL